MEKSEIVAIWTNSWALVPYEWISTCPLSKGNPSFHQQEVPDLSRMTRQYLTVPDTSVSPDRFVGRVGLVQTDFHGRLLHTTMIDLMWDKQAP